MNDGIKKSVREHYAAIARSGSSCCGPGAGGCCGTSPAWEMSSAVGYSQGEMAAVPEGANLGLGCGNPLAFAELKEGDVVVDLGSGAGPLTYL